MAIITVSPLVSEIRGDVGAISFSRNRYGPFVRAKIQQVNPDTEFQQLRRAAMAEGISAWQAINEETYQAWLNFVSSHSVPGRLPGRHRRAAYSEFTGRYMNRSLLGSAAVGFSPLPECRKFPWITGVTIGTDTLSVSIDSNEATGFVSVAVFASEPKSPGIRSVNPSWCSFIGFADIATEGATIDIYEEYITRYALTGDVNGKRIFVAIKAINNDNFAASLKCFDNGIISGWPSFIDTFDDTFDETFT